MKSTIVTLFFFLFSSVSFAQEGTITLEYSGVLKKSSIESELSENMFVYQKVKITKVRPVYDPIERTLDAAWNAFHEQGEKQKKYVFHITVGTQKEEFKCDVTDFGNKRTLAFYCPEYRANPLEMISLQR